MKKFIWSAVILLSAMGCLDDKTNYDYRDINDNTQTIGYIIKNFQEGYVLYPGEEVTIDPVVRLSIDTLGLNVNYKWYLNGKVVSEEKAYTYKATQIGSYPLTFSAIDKATGVAFSRSTSIAVRPPLESGWLLLTESPSGASEISMVLGKVSSRLVINEDGREVRRDTVIYSEVRFNLVPNLGTGPIKVVENYAWGPDDQEIKSEVMVLQRSGAVEVDGTNLQRIMVTANDFDGGKAPDGFMAKDAALTWGTKWLLNEKDNKLYGCMATVTSDLHSGVYSLDPAFNGKEFKDILPMYKDGSNSYWHEVIIAIDKNNTMYGILDDGTPTNHDKNDYSMYFDNHNGGLVELKGDDGVDMSWFENFTGEYIFHANLNPEYSSPYFSIVSRGGGYYWHQFEVEISYRYVSGPIEITESEVGTLNSQMFTDFVDAVLLPSNSETTSLLIVASGNKLYAAEYLEKDGGRELKGDFSSRIVGVAAKDSDENDYNSQLGVILEDGNFYVYEVIPSTDETSLSLKEVFHRNLKEMNPNFGKVVDFVVKYGDGANISFSRPF